MKQSKSHIRGKYDTQASKDHISSRAQVINFVIWVRTVARKFSIGGLCNSAGALRLFGGA